MPEKAEHNLREPVPPPQKEMRPRGWKVDERKRVSPNLLQGPGDSSQVGP
jgi:hypothetical protein